MLKNGNVFRKSLSILSTVMLMIGGRQLAHSQSCTAPVRTYANFEDHGNTAAALATSSTSGTNNAVGANPTNTPAVLNVATLLGAAEAWIELKFTTSTIPAGSTTYVKIGGSSAINVLNLLSGSSAPVYAYSGATSATTVAGQGTQIAAANVKASSFTAPDGSIYLAITSAVAYNAVRLAINASVIAGTGQLYVYHAYFQTSGRSCDLAGGAASSVSGVLTLGGAVTNPNNAFDNDRSTATTFSMGAAGVGTTLKETIYFPGPSNTGDAATITFSIPSALLVDLSLLNNITMTPYNGNVAGTPVSLATLLSIDLLSLLRGDNKVTISLVPGQTFDRIELSMTSLVSLIGQVNLYEVQRTPGKPTFTLPASQNVVICSGQSTVLSATTGPCNELHWYTSATGGTATIGSTYSTAALSASRTYYVAAAVIGCSSESERVPVTVTVNNISAGTIAADQTICSGTLPTAFTNTTAVGMGTITYKWQKSTDNTTYTDIAGATNIAYSETANLTQTTYYRRQATSTFNTVACSALSNVLKITVNPLPTASISGTSTVCQYAPSPFVTFTGASGTPPYTFTYKINAGANLAVSTTSGNTVTVSSPSHTPGAYVYTLVSVKDASTTACSQNQTGTATLTITAKPAPPTLNISYNH